MSSCVYCKWFCHAARRCSKTPCVSQSLSAVKNFCALTVTLKVSPNARNISNQNFATPLRTICCTRLGILLLYVVRCWMVQQDGRTCVTCSVQQCGNVLRYNVACFWPGFNTEVRKSRLQLTSCSCIMIYLQCREKAQCLKPLLSDIWFLNLKSDCN